MNRIENTATDWRWPSRRSIELLHEEAIAEHGGTPGLRDADSLNSLLVQLTQNTNQSERDIAQLAASCGCGLIKKHAFIDGNKRVAFLSVGLFLFLNGYRLNASQVDAARTILKLAASEISEEQFAAWIHTNIESRI